MHGVGRRSPRSLYNTGSSTFGESSGQEQADAAGLIRLLGLPLEAESRRGGSKDGKSAKDPSTLLAGLPLSAAPVLSPAGAEP
jgi:hypothetical protein